MRDAFVVLQRTTNSCQSRSKDGKYHQQWLPLRNEAISVLVRATNALSVQASGSGQSSQLGILKEGKKKTFRGSSEASLQGNGSLRKLGSKK